MGLWYKTLLLRRKWQRTGRVQNDDSESWDLQISPSLATFLEHTALLPKMWGHVYCLPMSLIFTPVWEPLNII